MLKRKTAIIIFSLIILVLLIISFILIFQKEKNNRVLSMYNNMCNKQNFTFTMEEIDSEYDYKISISQRGVDTSIDMYSGDEHTSTLILEGHAYFIMHNEEEYFNYDNDNTDGDIILSGLKEAQESQYINGHEEIKGKSYYYEEYDNISNFLIFLDADDDSVVKTRFYFDDDNIVYIKNIVINKDEEQQEELLKTTLKYEIENSLFEIPENYAEM